MAKIKVFFELNGFCEHCSALFGPMYYVNDDGTQWCLNCGHANGLSNFTYKKYRKKLSLLEKKFKEQMEELNNLEASL